MRTLTYCPKFYLPTQEKKEKEKYNSNTTDEENKTIAKKNNP